MQLSKAFSILIGKVVWNEFVIDIHIFETESEAYQWYVCFTVCHSWLIKVYKGVCHCVKVRGRIPQMHKYRARPQMIHDDTVVHSSVFKKLINASLFASLDHVVVCCTEAFFYESLWDNISWYTNELIYINLILCCPVLSDLPEENRNLNAKLGGYHLINPWVARILCSVAMELEWHRVGFLLIVLLEGRNKAPFGNVKIWQHTFWNTEISEKSS